MSVGISRLHTLRYYVLIRETGRRLKATPCHITVTVCGFRYHSPPPSFLLNPRAVAQMQFGLFFERQRRHNGERSRGSSVATLQPLLIPGRFFTVSTVYCSLLSSFSRALPWATFGVAIALPFSGAADQINAYAWLLFKVLSYSTYGAWCFWSKGCVPFLMLNN